MRKLKTRAQFQAMMAHLPVAKTPHFVLYRLPAGHCASSTNADAPAVDGAYLPVADFLQAQRAFAACAENEKASTDHLWLGALVPKRWAKHAVTRNLVRRQIAAVLAQTQQHPCPSGDEAFAPKAFLVRMRDGFHAKKTHRPKSHKDPKGPQALVPDSPQPSFDSASSCVLKQEVRQELLALFSRANKPPLAHRKRANSV